jgi:N-acetyl-anhydromuramyl-L-alanine amidase AmpD
VVVAAFQRRFRPERWDGRLDAETSQRLSDVRAGYDRARRP